MNAFILLYFSNTELSQEKKLMYFNNLKEAKIYFNALKTNHINSLVTKNIKEKQEYFNDDTNYFINWQTDKMLSQYCTFHIEIIEMSNASVVDLTKFM